ncbi:hypothetical protein SAMD00023353_0402120 [Rosellinia necatrix]|uniref:Uncharacterized protein n=1 Tax=Rosellinia necatrix TaxID=77044 RepID=A0A1S7ULA9_ROSNE|nr:hypothetical protein SAMD00023353_0402120 [Rosellinia necatrix]
MPHFTIAEPHPTVTQNAYTHSGRGGAGNYFRAPATTTTTATPSTATAAAPSSSSSTFYSGRGGAGNARVAEQRPVLSFDDELRLQSHMEQKRVGHVGRGGAGNVFDDAAPSPRRKDSDGASSTSSAGSFVGRVSSVFARR